jgi:hypothetical protein
MDTSKPRGDRGENELDKCNDDSRGIGGPYYVMEVSLNVQLQLAC